MEEAVVHLQTAMQNLLSMSEGIDKQTLIQMLAAVPETPKTPFTPNNAFPYPPSNSMQHPQNYPPAHFGTYNAMPQPPVVPSNTNLQPGQAFTPSGPPKFPVFDYSQNSLGVTPRSDRQIRAALNVKG